MKIGLLGRCDNRGIGYQTLEFFRNMPVERTLAVTMGDPAWPEDLWRFGRNVVHVDSNLNVRRELRGLHENRVRNFLAGLDIVFAVETVYDWRLIDWAHEAGAKVVIQGNPEFYAHHNQPTWQHPDRWVWPTDWMIDELPSDYILPVPTTARPNVAADPNDEVLRILHPAGKAAAGDRAGTEEFLDALPSIRQPAHVTIVTQEKHLPRQIRHARQVTVEVVTGGVEDRWEMYCNQHIAVIPRKYGGLCLPALEALACGLCVMMPGCSPNETWPGPRIPPRKGRVQRTPFGLIQTWTVHPIDIASRLDRLNRDRTELMAELNHASRWAADNSWDELRDRLYIPMFEDVLGS